MWRVEKVWRAGEKKIIILPSATKNTRQKHYFAECKQKTLGKSINLPSVKKKHTAYLVFAECL